MNARVSFEVADGITRSLRGMATRANSASAYLNRVLFRQYQKAQIERFQSENTTQTGQWAALSKKYLVRKKREAVAKAWPGAGNAIMIASGKLKDAATGRSNYLKTVTNTQFTVSIDTGAIPYAIYPGRMRPFMEFTEAQEQEWMDGITAYLARGEVA